MHDAGSSALGPARTLALVRMVAGALLVISGDVHMAPRYAGLDPALIAPPPGVDWLRAVDPSPQLSMLLVWVVVGCAAAGAVGLYARAAFGVVACGLFVLLALPHRLGSVTHSHHLIWVSALLAASPCADVWSADCYFAPRTLRPPAAYGLPLGVLRALVACVYFFPGLHKLRVILSGVSLEDWMRSHLAWKWLQHGGAPPVFRALSPRWFGLLAASAIGFELGMPLLVAFRRTRPLSLLSAIGFHLGTAWLLFIRFESLAVLLASLVDLPPRGARLTLLDLRQAGARATWVVGMVLVGGALLTGFGAQTQQYPFACYPTFAEPSPPTMPSARIVLRTDGRRCALPRARTSPQWIAAFRIAGAYGDELTPRRASAYVQHTWRALGNASRCSVSANTQVELWLERLAWDFEQATPSVVAERVVYTEAASALGMAPAGGTNASSSPER